MAETTKQRAARLNVRTTAALLEEERTTLRTRTEERAAHLEKVSPPCANTWKQRGKARSCKHKLNVHEPCSKCACRTFKGADGASAEEAAAALARAHPDLYPKPIEEVH
jgi:hypothetical protein